MRKQGKQRIDLRKQKIRAVEPLERAEKMRPKGEQMKGNLKY